MKEKDLSPKIEPEARLTPSRMAKTTTGLAARRLAARRHAARLAGFAAARLAGFAGMLQQKIWAICVEVE